jgi:hypothetical protein
MTKYRSVCLIATLALGLAACSSDKESVAPAHHPDSASDSGPASSAEGGADSEFNACLATVKPSCVVSEMNTAEKMQIPCASLTMIPVPLTDGTEYGPKTIKGGPYGGKIDWNVGAGTDFVNPVNMNEPVCLPTGVQTFKEPDSVNAEILNTRDIDYSLYTIFRPACMKDGETYPVITWANGTCGLTHGYAPLLSTLASHGFVIVASNSTWTATAPTDGVQVRALDYAAALNENQGSILYHRLNMDKVGAMGHSQGALATIKAGADPRIKSLIFWNGGVSNDKPFLYVSADRDVGGTSTPASLAMSTDGATQPGAWIYYHQVLETGGGSTGHLVLMEQPDRVVDMAIAWWQYQLNGDQEAKKTFVGDSCVLCNRASEFEYGINTLMK